MNATQRLTQAQIEYDNARLMFAMGIPGVTKRQVREAKKRLDKAIAEQSAYAKEKGTEA